LVQNGLSPGFYFSYAGDECDCGQDLFERELDRRWGAAVLVCGVVYLLAR
jgi:hypothetical protein